MCMDFYAIDEVMRVLKNHNVTNLYHANTVKTACSYLVYNGLFSRYEMELRGYAQTAQISDDSDKKYRIYNDIFFDSCDIHQRAHNINQYGPVLFVFSNEVINEAHHIAVTKKNPIYWEKPPQLDMARCYFNDLKSLEEGFKYGNFGQSITFHNQNQVSFDALQEIVFDCLPSNLLGQEKFRAKWECAYQKLRDLVQQLNKPVAITVRSCDEMCKCGETYLNNNKRIDKFFDI